MSQTPTSKTAKNIEKSPKNKDFPLNDAQKAAAEAPIAPLLIVAGAGTGKTRTLTSRIIYLIEHGTPPERICAITFTNKAAQEMLSRVSAARGPLNGGAQPFLGTFHSFGARLLRRECRTFGRKPNFAIFDDHDSFDLLKKIVKAAVPKEKSKRDTPAFFAQKIAETKNLDAPVFGVNESEERKELVHAVFKRYEEALMRNNAFDFDDLIEKPVALFKKYPAALKRYQELFDAVLVDEYQDINPKQYELVKLLAGGHRNLSVVGDDEQTIYSWRYANIKTFLNFDKEWPRANVFFLEENYRSTGNIIRAAAAVVGNNQFRTPKKLFTQNEDGEQISLFEAWGENDEAEWIADQIGAAMSERDDGAKAAKKVLSDFAILYRTNAQSRAIEQALIRHEMPYQIFGGMRFYERREVKDAVAAMRWAANHADEVAGERLEKNLSKRKFAVFKSKIGAEENLKPADVMKIFLETFGYFEYLEGNFLNADEREENIGELINFASSFDSLPELLEKVSLLQATDDEAGGAKAEGKAPAAARKLESAGKKQDKVCLMTIHLAKGLEFKNVFIAGVAEGLLPHIRSIESVSSLEEERRLMYVAMTRAREKLHLSFSGMPSRFISEIPAESIALAVVPDAEGDEASDENGESNEERAGSGERFADGNERDDLEPEEKIISLDW
jgi:DNA helicase II / ATP-dependent DNA helicase PcrA